MEFVWNPNYFNQFLTFLRLKRFFFFNWKWTKNEGKPVTSRSFKIDSFFFNLKWLDFFIFFCFISRQIKMTSSLKYPEFVDLTCHLLVDHFFLLINFHILFPNCSRSATTFFFCWNYRYKKVFAKESMHHPTATWYLITKI